MNRETRMRKANYIRKEEINLCRFVEICYSVIERNIEGKWEYVGKVKEKGLQIRRNSHRRNTTRMVMSLKKNL